MSIHLPVLTNSSISCFNRCKREYEYRYVRLRRPRAVSAALRFGTMFHVGLNAWWKEQDREQKLMAALSAIANHLLSVEDPDLYEVAMAEALLIGYTARWGDAPYRTLAVEQEFRTDIPFSGMQLAGKVDAVAALPDGTTVLIEHKTTSEDIEPGSDYWRNVVLTDSQVSTYLSLTGADHVVYDVIRKPALRPLKATPEESRRYTKAGRLDARQRLEDETTDEYRLRLIAEIDKDPDKYFRRAEVVRLEREIQEFMADVRDVAVDIESGVHARRYARSTGACRRYGRFCSYFDVCSGTASIDDEMLFRTAETPHEELEEVA